MSRTSLFRAELAKIDDSSDDHQLADAYGHAGEMFEAMHRVQTHGFAASPPVGSHGVGLRMGGESDLAVLLGLVDPTTRGKYAKNLNPGDATLYNADGSVWKMVGKSPTFDCPETCTLTAKSFVFKCGGITWTLDGNGWRQTGGGMVQHDSHDIGKTHKHLNSGGGGLGGIPQ